MGIFTFYRSWTPRMTPRSSATHAPGSGIVSTDALSLKIGNLIKMCLALKGLIRRNLKISITRTNPKLPYRNKTLVISFP